MSDHTALGLSDHCYMGDHAGCGWACACECHRAAATPAPEGLAIMLRQFRLPVDVAGSRMPWATDWPLDRLMCVAAETLLEMAQALEALANKVDATSECDHTRISCEEIGCIGAEVRRARAVLARQQEGE